MAISKARAILGNSVFDKKSLAYERKMDIAATPRNSYHHPENEGKRRIAAIRKQQQTNYKINSAS